MYYREKWISHKDKQILHRDYTNLESEKALEVIDGFIESTVQMAADGKREVLIFSDITGATGDKASVGKMKKLSKLNGKMGNRAACIGADGMKKAFLTIVNAVSPLNVKAFDSKEQALDWLVEQ